MLLCVCVRDQTIIQNNIPSIIVHLILIQAQNLKLYKNGDHKCQITITQYKTKIGM